MRCALLKETHLHYDDDEREREKKSYIELNLEE